MNSLAPPSDVVTARRTSMLPHLFAPSGYVHHKYRGGVSLHALIRAAPNFVVSPDPPSCRGNIRGLLRRWTQPRDWTAAPTSPCCGCLNQSPAQRGELRRVAGTPHMVRQLWGVPTGSDAPIGRCQRLDAEQHPPRRKSPVADRYKDHVWGGKPDPQLEFGSAPRLLP